MFRTRSPGEVRGPSVGAGYPRGATVRRVTVAPAAREGQLGHSWSLGWGGMELELGPSEQEVSAPDQSFSTGPLHSPSLCSFILPGAISFL